MKVDTVGLRNPAGQLDVEHCVKPVAAAASRTPWKAIFSILFALFYDASPIDLIPDVIPILGWLDDGLVTLLMFAFAFATLRKWAKARKLARQSPAIVR